MNDIPDETLQAFALACFYLGMDEDLKIFREDIEKFDFPPKYRVSWCSDDSEALKLIYGWLVCMFGDYGVNPQNGWINKTYECWKFLVLFESMVKGETADDQTK